MKELQLPGQKVWYDEELLLEDPTHCFAPEFWQKNGKVTGSATGRGTTWFIQTERLEAALRHYRRGGLFGKVVADQYWFKSWSQTRSYQEYLLLSLLREAEVNVPRPIAARAVKNGCIYRADLLSEKISGASDLVDILKNTALDEETYVAIGAMIRRMHNAQVNHTDLNIHNILIDQDHQIWLIDFDKCAVREEGGWKQNNLDRLRRSFLKERQRAQIQWREATDWPALMLGYQTGG